MLLEKPVLSPTEYPPPYEVPTSGEDSKVPLDESSNGAIPTGPPSARPVRSLFTYTHYKNISGAYCIDPDLAGHPIEIQPRAACHHKGKGKGRFRSPPDASFFSNHGNITVKLAASSSHGGGKPARVNIGTRSGNVLVTLFDVENPRHLNLEITTRRGNVALLVPRSFSGALHLHTRRGSLSFLPHFARYMRELKTTNNEALVLFGTSNTSSADSSTADYCELTARFGSVIVGLAGQDHFSGHESSFWKKLGDYFMATDLQTGVVGEAKMT